MIDLNDINSPRFDSVRCDTPDGLNHNLHWTEWGDPDNKNLLICAHGLSRNSRDFDYLARALADRYRVICPDYPGRGLSDSLVDPGFYSNEQYLGDTLTLFTVLEFEQLDWIGTSMGGLIGMNLASGPENPIRRMVINDVGAHIPGNALTVISDYLRIHPQFSNLEEAENYYREVYASFGPLEDEHYQHFVRHGIKQSDDQDGYVLNYDPAIIDQFTSANHQDIELWELWARVTIPTLIIRGQKSGLLLSQTVEKMKESHSGAQSVEFPDCAHAPSLMVESQIAVIDDWLRH